MNRLLLDITRQIATAYVRYNPVSPQHLPGVVEGIAYGLIESVQSPMEVATPRKQKPAVRISESIKHDYIVCLEDGKKLMMLQRYLRTKHDLSPEQYREKWNLPFDYPMICPAYRQIRSDSAKENGFGTKVRRRRP